MVVLIVLTSLQLSCNFVYLLARINLVNEVSRGQQPFSKSYKTSEKGCSILHAWRVPAYKPRQQSHCMGGSYKGIEFKMVYWCLVCNWLAIQPIGVDCIRGLCTCRLVHVVRSTSIQLTTDHVPAHMEFNQVARQANVPPLN